MNCIFFTLVESCTFYFWPDREACVADITLVQQLTCVKQGWDPWSAPSTDSASCPKCILNFPSTWLANQIMPFLAGQSWHLLKSWYKAEGPEQGFWHWLTHWLYQKFLLVFLWIYWLWPTCHWYYFFLGCLRLFLFLVWTEYVTYRTVQILLLTFTCNSVGNHLCVC